MRRHIARLTQASIEGLRLLVRPPPAEPPAQRRRAVSVADLPVEAADIA